MSHSAVETAPVLEGVVQDDGPLSGQGGARRHEPVVEADGGRILGDLRFPGEKDFPDQFQFRVPVLEFSRVVDAGKLQEAGDGRGAGDVPAGPDGKAGSRRRTSRRWPVPQCGLSGCPTRRPGQAPPRLDGGE